ncbi:hypothetical protein DPMN_083934 [Dreissena polymorpha]|uniref:Uncharacterized protein n=1 Tax=Dreissena polymorpha TaxID=45954 RepID=A0A9D3YDY8_DREPO|nr:hypothetical protein DPMN_083934 [Dreissena polymorpha]
MNQVLGLMNPVLGLEEPSPGIRDSHCPVRNHTPVDMLQYYDRSPHNLFDRVGESDVRNS